MEPSPPPSDALGRILAQTGVDLRHCFLKVPGAQRAAAEIAVENWLSRCPVPEGYASLIAQSPKAEGGRFVALLGLSRPVQAILGQNPELASLLFEGERVPRELYADDRDAFRRSITAEGELMLRAASSTTHALDRLRYLKQKSLLLVSWFGMEAASPERVGWGLTQTADALIGLTLKVAWESFSRTKGLDGPCPILVVAFGKLGGGELNLSSDIDLAYVLPDSLDERRERDLFRFCEAFGRALSDPMGRGNLYRVDLRLRPYGSRGEIARSLRGYEAYYRNYAEGWEMQALLRTRPVAGDAVLARKWETVIRPLLRERIFGPEFARESLEMRARTEGLADPNDIKRGHGGIRDVEWIAQIEGMLLSKSGGTEVRGTREALDALASQGAIPAGDAQTLKVHYDTLRDIENALQLRGDLQTHTLPDDLIEGEAIAALTRCGRRKIMVRALARAREEVARLYVERFDPVYRGARVDTVSQGAGRFLARFDPAYVGAVAASEGSTARITTALTRAPAIMKELRDDEVLEGLISGEIIERDDRLGHDGPSARRAHARHWLRFALIGERPPSWASSPSGGSPLAVAFAGMGLDVLLLGSHALGTAGPDADLDLLLLHRDAMSSDEADQKGRAGLETLRRWAGEGAPTNFDLRLRPDGGKGILVRSRTAFRAYAESGMAPWERIALSKAVVIRENEGRIGYPDDIAWYLLRILGHKFAGEEIRELLDVKDRVERERAQGLEDIKLGPGGIMDLEWLVEFRKMAGRGYIRLNSFEDEIRAARLGPEFEILRDARWRLQLLGLGDMLSPVLGEETVARVRAAQKTVRGRWLALREDILS